MVDPEDKILSITHMSGKIAVCGWALIRRVCKALSIIRRMKLKINRSIGRF